MCRWKLSGSTLQQFFVFKDRAGALCLVCVSVCQSNLTAMGRPKRFTVKCVTFLLKIRRYKIRQLWQKQEYLRQSETWFSSLQSMCFMGVTHVGLTIVVSSFAKCRSTETSQPGHLSQEWKSARVLADTIAEKTAEIENVWMSLEDYRWEGSCESMEGYRPTSVETYIPFSSSSEDSGSPAP